MNHIFTCFAYDWSDGLPHSYQGEIWLNAKTWEEIILNGLCNVGPGDDLIGCTKRTWILLCKG